MLNNVSVQQDVCHHLLSHQLTVMITPTDVTESLCYEVRWCRPTHLLYREEEGAFDDVSEEGNLVLGQVTVFL